MKTSMEEQTRIALELDELTYRCPRLKDFTLDENLPTAVFPPKIGALCESPKADLGALDLLPLELLHLLLLQLDLRSLTDFRRVNQRAMQVVESITQYRAVITNAPGVLRCIISINAGQWVTCQNLYDKLCTPWCEQCGDFGGYLYVLTCKRVCFLCLSEDKEFLPLKYSDAIRKFGVDRQIIGTLPHMRSIPGTYSPNEKICRAQLSLVDSGSARRAGIALHGSFSAVEQHVSDVAARKLQQYNKRAARATADGTGATSYRPRRARDKDLFDGQSGNPLRFMAIVRMPWLNRVSQKPEWGFHCIGCENCHYSRPLHFRRKFTAASLSEHLRQCGKLRNGKHHLD